MTRPADHPNGSTPAAPTGAVTASAATIQMIGQTLNEAVYHLATTSGNRSSNNDNESEEDDSFTTAACTQILLDIIHTTASLAQQEQSHGSGDRTSASSGAVNYKNLLVTQPPRHMPTEPPPQGVHVRALQQRPNNEETDNEPSSDEEEESALIFTHFFGVTSLPSLTSSSSSSSSSSSLWQAQTTTTRRTTLMTLCAIALFNLGLVRQAQAETHCHASSTRSTTIDNTALSAARLLLLHQAQQYYTQAHELLDKCILVNLEPDHSLMTLYLAVYNNLVECMTTSLWMTTATAATAVTTTTNNNMITDENDLSTSTSSASPGSSNNNSRRETSSSTTATAAAQQRQRVETIRDWQHAFIASLLSVPPPSGHSPIYAHFCRVSAAYGVDIRDFHEDVVMQEEEEEEDGQQEPVEAQPPQEQP